MNRSASSARKTFICGLLLVAATAIAYFPAWNGKPIWDDNAHITQSALRSAHGLVEIWTRLGATQQYYPLLHTVFWFEQKLWGDSVVGYHLVNILLHALSALVLLQILRRLEIRGALLAAGLFALHPVQVESVAWISELKNTLSGLFFFLSILSYLKFDETRSRRSYLGALMFFLFGLLCKTVIAPLTAIMLVLVWWKRGRLRMREDIVALLPFFGLGVGAGLFTAWVEKTFVGAQGAAFQLSILQRCLIAARDFWFYLFKLVWPARLTFIYPRWQISPATWSLYLSAFALALLLVIAWMVRKKFRGALAALLIFLGLLFPALGFVNVYPFLYSFVADHFQYLACIAPLTLIATGLRRALDSASAKNFLRRTVYALLLLGLGILTWHQCYLYKDIETLWRTAISRNPAAWMAYSNLGSLLLTRGNADEAIADFHKALELWPQQSKDHNNLGKALAQKGQIVDAVQEFATALKISPNDPDAETNIGAAFLQRGEVDEAISHLRRVVEKFPRYAEARINLGNALLQQRDPDGAIAEYEQTLQLSFDHAESFYSIANAFRQKGDVAQAIIYYRKAIASRPDYVSAHNNLGNALRQEGRIPEAVAEYEAALKSNSGFLLAQNNLAWLLATSADPKLRNGTRAVQLAEQAAIATDGNDPVILQTLAVAYAEDGQYGKALAAANEALDIAEKHGITALAESLRSKIALFQSSAPYHEDSTPRQ